MGKLADKAEEYRVYADRCLAHAKEMRNPELRRELERIAQGWLADAEMLEQKRKKGKNLKDRQLVVFPLLQQHYIYFS